MKIIYLNSPSSSQNVKYEVGKPYPVNNIANGTERPLVSFNDVFFDVAFYSLQAKEDKNWWTKGQLKYAVFNSKNVPFFILDWPKDQFNLDASMNFLNVQDDKVDEWLNSKSNIINMFLIDARTNILEGMRMISVNNSIADQIRGLLEKQDNTYADSIQVDAVILEVTAKYSTNDMLNISKSFTAN